MSKDRDAAAPAAPVITAWLIELQSNGAFKGWLSGNDEENCGWTTDPNSAIKFASKSDADMARKRWKFLCDHASTKHLSTEHVWLDAASAAPAPDEDALVQRLRGHVDDAEYIISGESKPHPLMAEAADLIEQQARELAQVMRERNDANRACLEELTRADRAERDLAAARADAERMRAALVAADELRVLIVNKCDRTNLMLDREADALTAYDTARAATKGGGT